MPEQPRSEPTPSRSATATAEPEPAAVIVPPPGEDLTIAQNWPCQPERETDEQWMLRRQLYRPWSLQPDDIVPNWPQIAMGMTATTFAAIRMQADQPPQSRPAEPPKAAEQATQQAQRPERREEPRGPQPGLAPEQVRQQEQRERREERRK